MTVPHYHQKDEPKRNRAEIDRKHSEWLRSLDYCSCARPRPTGRYYGHLEACGLCGKLVRTRSVA